MEQLSQLSLTALARRQGSIAGFTGLKRGDNPNPQGTPEHLAWWRGWDDATDALEYGECINV